MREENSFHLLKFEKNSTMEFDDSLYLHKDGSKNVGFF